MFCKNNVNGKSTLLDNMPEYLKAILKKSWANIFQERIFININEERFSVLYSNDHASRPNTPINVLIGLLILKETFQLTDEELIGSLHFDIRFQYALRTMKYEKQPVSINTLTNFRKRLYEYEKSTGIDLIKEEVEAQAQIIGEILEIENVKIRMDSLMVSSSCGKLSRIELVYSVNVRFIKILSEVYSENVPETCKEYLTKGYKNETIYRTRDKDAQTKLEFLLSHSETLYNAGLKIGETITHTQEFILLERMLKDQTVQNDKGELCPKLGKDILSTSLQNPTDPDATYRKKYVENVGYVGNLVECFDWENSSNSVISTYDLQANIYSDAKFADDVIEKIVSENIINIPSADGLDVIIDGGFFSQERGEKASEFGINLIPSELVGRKSDEKMLRYTEFVIDEEKHIIVNCANLETPVETSYNEITNVYFARYSKEQCENCPYSSSCPTKKQKKSNVVTFTEKKYMIDLQRDKMKTDEYIELTNKRAAVEGLPSVLRRRYKVDRMPVRGLIRSKLWFAFKIAAYNVKKLLKCLELSKVFLHFILKLGSIPREICEIYINIKIN